MNDHLYVLMIITRAIIDHANSFKYRRLRKLKVRPETCLAKLNSKNKGPSIILHLKIANNVTLKNFMGKNENFYPRNRQQTMTSLS